MSLEVTVLAAVSTLAFLWSAYAGGLVSADVGWKTDQGLAERVKSVAVGSLLAGMACGITIEKLFNL